MSISSLNSSTYSAPLGSNTATTAKQDATSTPVTKASIGKDLLATLALRQAGQATMFSSSLQDQVSLGSSTSSTPLTYDAKGLLQQLQNNMQNNPLFQGDNTDNSDSGNSLNSVIQQALNAKQGTDGSSTSQSTNSSQGNLAQLLKQNPSLAKSLMQSQSSQSMLSILA